MSLSINLAASKIAGMIGMNPYYSVDEAKEELYCKVKKIKQRTLDDEKVLTSNEKEKIAKVLLPNMDTTNMTLENVLEVSCRDAINTTTCDDSIQKEELLNKIIKEHVEDGKDTKLVSEFITSTINKSRGIKNEDKIIKDYNNKNKTYVTDNNSKFYRYKLFEDFKKYNINIVAKIDGLDKGCLIEVKNRRNRLFNKIVEYEKVQLEIYLRILDITDAKLVENYNNTFVEHIYTCDDNFWNLIKERLYDFLDNFIDTL